MRFLVSIQERKNRARLETNQKESPKIVVICGSVFALRFFFCLFPAKDPRTWLPEYRIPVLVRKERNLCINKKKRCQITAWPVRWKQGTKSWKAAFEWEALEGSLLFSFGALLTQLYSTENVERSRQKREEVRLGMLYVVHGTYS